MEVLLETPHGYLRIEREHRFVRYDRTSLPFESVAEYDRALERLLDALRPFDRARHIVLVDMRSGPIRSGDDFEASALRFRREMFRGFARAAVLVATDIGRLQITRHEKQNGPGPVIFRDEDEALKYLGVRGAASTR